MGTELALALPKLAGKLLKDLNKIKSETVTGEDATTDQLLAIVTVFGTVAELVEEQLVANKSQHPKSDLGQVG